ncbi:MAG: asparagine synthase (glutamine-hydrolyzing) [Bacteroidia bacterium]
MCGINGIYSFSGEGDFSSQVERMNDRLAHRGPDDAGVFLQHGIALGHRRLSIIDLSSAGHQPMYSHDRRYVIVFNGEIYNYRELRQQLKHYPFRTNTDTEVILAGWKEWGAALPEKLNGMFAFVLYDCETNELFIVRDRLGIKPLYYFCNEKHIAFSSEIRALQASGLFTPQLNLEVLGDFLRYQTVHAPQTILKDVVMLMPGHYLKVHQKGFDTVCWWKPEVKPERAAHDYQKVCTDIRSLLRDAVERRLVADVPFGAFLSGGIDSSVVVGLMSEVAASSVSTFNIAFDDSEFSEARYARKIAQRFHTSHHEILLKPEDLLHHLPDALSDMDHPSGDGPNTWMVSNATKQAGITMALSGLGGDELFAGYDIFKRAQWLQSKQWLNMMPKSLRHLAGNMIRNVRPGVAGEKMAAVLALEKINFNSFYPFSREVLNASVIHSLVNKKTDGTDHVAKIVNSIADVPEQHYLLSRVSLAEIQTYMQNVLLRDTDQMSMAHALEVRVPFLDYTLVEYVLAVKDEFKYPSTPKKLLTDSVKDLLPEEIIHRPKMGFTLPWKSWIKNELRTFCETQLHALGQREIFNHQQLQHLYQRFLKDDPAVTWSRIWHLVVLSYWLEKNNVN